MSTPSTVLDCLVEIQCESPDGKRRHASGVLVTSGVVVTARHALRSVVAPEQIRVRLAAEVDPSAWTRVNTVINPLKPDLDAVVLCIADPSDCQSTSDTQSLIPPIYVDCFGAISATALGFPWVRRFSPSGAEAIGTEETIRWDTDEIAGQIRPRSTARRAHLDLAVTTPIPRIGPHNRSLESGAEPIGWAGISGGPVFTSDGFLIGLIRTVDDEYRGDVLRVIRCTDLGEDEALRVYLPPDWRIDQARHLSATRPFQAGRSVIEFQPAVPARAPQQGLTPIEMLQAKYRVVPYITRPDEEARVDQWMEHPERASCGVLSGSGGAGKSRLAAELAQKYRDLGWATGLVELSLGSVGSGPAFELSDLGRRILLLVDYADYEVAFVADLLRAAHRSSLDRVRVLAVVRDGERFTRTLTREVSNLVDVPVNHLAAMTNAALLPAARVEHYRVARQAFRARLDGHTATQDDGSELPINSDDRYVDLCPTPLLAHARALVDELAEFDPGRQLPATTPAELFDSLLDREERRHWARRLGHLINSELHRKQVYGVATLVGAGTLGEAEEALQAISSPILSDRRGRLEVVEALTDTETFERLVPVEPDRLGEQLIARAILDHGLLPEVLETARSIEQRSLLLETLLRMAASDIEAVAEPAHRELHTLLRTHLGDLLEQALATATPEARSARFTLVNQLTAALEYFDDPSLVEGVDADVVVPDLRALDPLAAEIYRLGADRADSEQNYERGRELRIRQIEAIAGLGEVDALLEVTSSAISRMGRSSSSTNDPYFAQVLTAGAAARLGAGNLRDAYDVAGQALAASVNALGALEAPGTADHGRHLEAVSVRVVAALAVGATGEIDELTIRTIDQLRAAGEWSLLVRAASLRATARLLTGDTEDVVDDLHALRIELADRPEVDDSDRLGLELSLLAVLSGADRTDEATDLAHEIGSRFDDLPDDPGSDKAIVQMASSLILAAEAVGDDDPDLAATWARRAEQVTHNLSPGAETPYRAVKVHVNSMLAFCLMRNEELVDAQIHGYEALRAALGTNLEPTSTSVELWVAPVIVNALLDVEYDQPDDGINRLLQAIELAGRLGSEQAFSASLRLRFALIDVYVNLDRHEEAATVGGQLVGLLERRRNDNQVQVLPLLINALVAHALTLAGAEQPQEATLQLDRAEREASRLQAKVHNDQTVRLVFLCRALRALARKESGHLDEAVRAIRWALDTEMPSRPTDFDRQGRVDLVTALAEIQDERSPATDNSPPKRIEDLVPGRNRVILGRLRGKEIAARAYRPVIVLGPQRSRKTTGVVIPTLLRWEGPAVVTSVRQDVVHGSIVRRQGMGGKVWIFEPTSRLFKPGGEALTTWSPLNGCDNWDTAISTAHAFTEASQPATGTSGLNDSAFWYSQATQLLQPLLFAAATFNLSMGDVNRWARTEARAELQARLTQMPSTEPLKVFNAMVDLPEATKGGIYATLRSLLRAYDSDTVRASSVESDFTVAQFFDGRPNTLYLVSPPDVQEELAPIFTALVRTLINFAYHHQGSDHKLLLMLDEAGNIAKIKNLETVATTAAGTGIQLVSVFHDLAQMESIYGGPGSRNIVNNHSGLLVLSGNRDPSTISLVERLLVDEGNAGKGGRKRRSVRMLEPGTALCFYEHLPHEVIELLSSTHDDELARLAGRVPAELVEPANGW